MTTRGMHGVNCLRFRLLLVVIVSMCLVIVVDGQCSCDCIVDSCSSVGCASCESGPMPKCTCSTSCGLFPSCAPSYLRVDVISCPLVGFNRYICQRENCPLSGNACRSCHPGYYGVECKRCPEGPSGRICSGSGTCSDGYAGDGTCSCAPEHVGSSCQYSRNLTCNGHGDAQPDGSCSCDTGWTGDTCSGCASHYFPEGVCDTYCYAPTTCTNRGTCDNQGKCECMFGYTGPSCSDEVVLEPMCYTLTYDYGRKSRPLVAWNTTTYGFPIDQADTYLFGPQPQSTHTRTGFESPDGMGVWAARYPSYTHSLNLVFGASCDSVMKWCHLYPGAVSSAPCQSCYPEELFAELEIGVYRNCVAGTCTTPFHLNNIEGKSMATNKILPCCGDTDNCQSINPSTAFKTFTALRPPVDRLGASNPYLVMHLPPDPEAYCLDFQLREFTGLRTVAPWSNSQNTAADPLNKTYSIRDFGTSFQVCGTKCSSFCTQYTSCGSCVGDSRCGWCATTQTCVAGDASGPAQGTRPATAPGPYAACPTYYYSGCPTCTGQVTCETCTAQSCAWCVETKTCMDLNADGQPVAQCRQFTTDASCAIMPLDLWNLTTIAGITQDFSSSTTGWSSAHVGSPSPAWSVDISSLKLVQTAETAFLQHFPSARRGAYFYVDTRSPTVHYTVDVDSSKGAVLGIVFRFMDSATFYSFEWGESKPKICPGSPYRGALLKRFIGENGVILRQVDIGFHKRTQYRVELVLFEEADLSATYISILIDGKHIFTYKDTLSERPMFGSLGVLTIHNNGASFDNAFRVSAGTLISAGVPYNITLWQNRYWFFQTPTVAPTEVVHLTTLEAAEWNSVFLNFTILSVFGDEKPNVYLYDTTKNTQKLMVYRAYTANQMDNIGTQQLHAKPKAVLKSQLIRYHTMSVNSVGAGTAASGLFLAKITSTSTYPSMTLNIALQNASTCTVNSPCPAGSRCTNAQFAPPRHKAGAYCSCPYHLQLVSGSCVSRPAVTDATVVDLVLRLSQTTDPIVLRDGVTLHSSAFVLGQIAVGVIIDPFSPNLNTEVSIQHSSMAAPITYSGSRPYEVVDDNVGVSRSLLPAAVPVAPGTWTISGSVGQTVSPWQKHVKFFVSDAVIFPPLLLFRAGQVPDRYNFDVRIEDDGTWSDKEYIISPVNKDEDYYVAIDQPNGYDVALTYSLKVQAPAVGVLSPTIGDTNGGYSLQIDGVFFGSTGTVLVGGLDCPVLTWSHESILCTCPPGAGQVQVVVYHEGKSSQPVIFTYNSPVISSVTPPTIPTEGGAVVLTGSNFGPLDQVQVDVLQHGVPCVIDVGASTAHNKLTCTVPPGAGSLTLRVNVSDSITTTSISYQAPVILSVMPPLIRTEADTITIRGKNFGLVSSGKATISTSFGAEATIQARNHTTIIAEMTNGGGGPSLLLSVTVLLQVSNTYTQVGFIPPKLSRMEPNVTSPVGDEVLTIYGENFGAAGTAMVQFGQRTVAASSRTHTSITVQIPSGSGANIPVSVVVETQTSSNHLVMSYRPPSVGFITPESVNTDGTALLTIVGSSFGLEKPTVTLGGFLTCDLTFGAVSWNNTHIVCVVPEGQGALLQVVVDVDGQLSQEAVHMNYSAPVIANISAGDYAITDIPTLGATITVLGKHFGVDASVSIELAVPKPCAVLIRDHVRIICRTSPGFQKDVDVVVSTNPMSAALSYPGRSIVQRAVTPNTTRIGFVQPTVDNLIPRLVDAETTTLTLLGSNFLDAGNVSPTITVGGVPCDVTQHESSQILCSLRTNQGIGLGVTAFFESVPIVSAKTVSYEPPRLLSVTPSVVPTSGVPQLNITGSSFGFLTPSRFDVYLQQCLTINDDAPPEQLSYFGAWTSQVDPTSYKSGFHTSTNSSASVTILLCADPLYRTGTYDVFLAEKAVATGSVAVTIDSVTQIVSADNAVDTRSRWIPLGNFSLNLVSTFTLKGTGGDVNFDAVMLCRRVPEVPINPSSVRVLGPALVSMSIPAAVGPLWHIRFKTLPSEQVSSVVDSLTLSYEAPTVSRVQGCAVNTANATSKCSPTQSTEIAIYGSGYGSEAALVWTNVSVYLKSTEFPCSNVRILSDNQINCTYPLLPGSAASFDVPVIVSVGGQVASANLFSFNVPVITPGTLRRCSTGSGTTGLHLDTATEVCFDVDQVSTDVAAWYGVATMDRSALQAGVAALPADSPFPSTIGVWFQCASTFLVGSTVHCEANTTVGADMQFVIRSEGLWSRLSSDRLTFTPPVILNNTIRGLVDAPLGSSEYEAPFSQGAFVVFDITGAPFSNETLWPLVVVDYTRNLFEYAPCTSVTLFSNNTAAYPYATGSPNTVALRCKAGSGTGTGYRFRVRVVNQPSSLLSNDTLLFPATTPIVTKVSGCSAGADPDATYNCPTKGGITLTIEGERFCEAQDCASVVLLVSVGVNLCTGSTALSPTKLTCQLPAGNGDGLLSAVTVSNLRETSPPKQLLSYGTAVVTSVKGCGDIPSVGTVNCPLAGGVQITIAGENFGASDAFVLVGPSRCEGVIHDSAQPHSRLYCTLPAGNGNKLAVAILPRNSKFVFSPDTVRVYYGVCSSGRILSGTICAQCPAGKAVTQDQLSCLSCTDGWYSPLPGATSCLACAAGKFTTSTLESALNGPGSTNCTLCPSGQYQGQVAGAGCISCPIGRYQDVAGSTACEACPAGRFTSVAGATSCTGCERGLFAEGTGSTRCAQCPSGRFSTGQASNCTSCLPGTFQHASGADGCAKCSVGYAQSKSGQPECVPCDSGQYANRSGLTTCAPCAPGTYASSTDLECSLCLPGRYLDTPGQSVCLRCTVGRFTSEYGSTTCQACPPGKVGNAPTDGIGSDGCVRCPNGTYSDEASSACTACSAGKFANLLINVNGSSTCAQCPRGKFQDNNGGVDCKLCAPGRFNQLSQGVGCLDCAGGSYQNASASTVCTLCPAGTASLPGSTRCIDCAPGRFGSGASKSGEECDPCGPGRFSNVSRATTCTPCAQGRYSEGLAAISCPLCGTGRYAPSIGAVSCFRCNEGTVAASKGLTTCTDCGPGRFNDAIVGSVCKDCANGRFASAFGTANCAVCLAGTFSAALGSHNCTSCPIGTFNERNGLSTCTSCPEGRIGLGLQQTRCAPCEAGKYSGSPGLSVCSLCPAGKFSSAEASSCLLCSSGLFATSDGQAICRECEAGRYSSADGSTTCSKCQVGTYRSAKRGVSCDPCQAGRFAASLGLSVCTTCSTGFFSNTSGASECAVCAEGKYQNSAESTTCLDCPKGEYSPAIGQARCLPCNQGSFGNITGQSDCSNCVPGRFQSRLGQTLCETCSAGTYAGGQASTVCSTCAVGTVSSFDGASSCTSCAAGQFNGFTAQSRCQTCPKGTASSVASAECIPCDPGRVASSAGSGSCRSCSPPKVPNLANTDCICDVGFFLDTRNGSSSGINDTQCAQCPGGASCNAPGVTFDDLSAEPGWWRPSETSLSFYQCLQESHCLGGRQSSCGALRSGPICAVCVEGAQSGTDGACKPCAGEGTNIAVFILIVIAIGLALWATYWAILYSDTGLVQRVKLRDELRVTQQKSNINDEPDMFRDVDDLQMVRSVGDDVMLEGFRPIGKPNLTYKIKVILGFFQIATNLTFNLDMPWPSTYRDFISIFSVFNIDFLQWSNAECVANISYYDKFFLVTLIPMGVIGLLALVYLVPYYRRFPAGTRFERSADSFTDREVLEHVLRRRLRRLKFGKLVLFTMFLVYPQVSSFIFRMYVCKTVEGVSYMMTDFKQQCYDSPWYDFLPFSIVMMVVYPIGIPAYFLYLLLTHRPKFREPETRLRIGFLYDGYTEQMWYFELIDIAHKLLLTSLIAFLPLDGQMPVAMLIVTGYSITILMTKPYYRKGDDRLHLFAQVELFLLVLAGYIFHRTRDDLDAKDEVIVSVFLILVIMSFIIVFLIQAAKIFKKMIMGLWNRAKKENASVKERLRLMKEYIAAGEFEQPHSMKQSSRKRMMSLKGGRDSGSISEHAVEKNAVLSASYSARVHNLLQLPELNTRSHSPSNSKQSNNSHSE